jgi:hypothetical protein
MVATGDEFNRGKGGAGKNADRVNGRRQDRLLDAQNTAGVGGANGFHHVTLGDDHQVTRDQEAFITQGLTASLAAITPSLWLSKYTGVTPR